MVIDHAAHKKLEEESCCWEKKKRLLGAGLAVWLSCWLSHPLQSKAWRCCLLFLCFILM